MKTILFQRQSQAYLPEVDAYLKFLACEYPEIRAYDSSAVKDPDPMDFDMVWRFTGLDVAGAGRYIVHEYNSLSSGVVPHLKNKVKQLVNKRPDRRVFLSKTVQQDFPFKDNVPYGFRDMGVASAFFEVRPAPEYDFVYAGSVHRGNEVLRLLKLFSEEALRGARILIVGSVNPDVRAHYSRFDNIVFAGRVPYEEVPSYMGRGRFGVNVLPDRYPFNVQTATKVLEYCALGLPIVSMRYRWIENFMEKRGGKVFWLDPDFKNLSLKMLENFDFKTPQVEDRRWHNVIADSKIFDFLKTV